MKHQYESELIEEIVDARGHKKSSLHYESECMETWIEEAKGAYPKLCDYESEWIKYISILDDTGGSEDPQPPIGEFPYVVLSDVTEATIDNVVPYAYKSAILKGQTLVNLVGEKREYKGPNLYGWEFMLPYKLTKDARYMVVFNASGTITDNSKVYLMDNWFGSNSGNTTYSVSFTLGYNKHITTASGDNHKVLRIRTDSQAVNDFKVSDVMLIPYQEGMENWDIPYFEGMTSVKMPVLTTSNEDGTKTNILTVNEEVELRGIGDVKDELNLLTGELTQRIDEVVLDGSDDEGWDFNGDRNEAVSIISNKIIGSLNATNIICADFVTSNNSGAQNIELIRLSTVSGKVIIHILKSKLGLASDITDIVLLKNSFKAWLSQNPLIVQYELETESVKTVDLTITNQDGETLNKLKPFEGTMHLSTSGENISPLFSGEIPVEAIKQNLAAFIDLEMEE